MKRFVAILLLSLSVCTFAQDRVDPKVQKIHFDGTKPFNEFVLENLDGESDFNVNIFIDKKKVTVGAVCLKKPVFIATQLCNSEKKPDLDEGFFYRVKQYSYYDYRGNVFAIEVNYEFFDAASGEEVGAATPGFYIATDDPRFFKLQCVDDFKIKLLPEWVKNASPVAPKK